MRRSAAAGSSAVGGQLVSGTATGRAAWVSRASSSRTVTVGSGAPGPDRASPVGGCDEEGGESTALLLAGFRCLLHRAGRRAGRQSPYSTGFPEGSSKRA